MCRTHAVCFVRAHCAPPSERARRLRQAQLHLKDKLQAAVLDEVGLVGSHSANAHAILRDALHSAATRALEVACGRGDANQIEVAMERASRSEVAEAAVQVAIAGSANH